MTHTPDIDRPAKDVIERLKEVSSATATGVLNKMGIRDSFLEGPIALTRGKHIAGPALTLQFMPLREDVYGADEYGDPELQLHRHVLYHTRPGDVVVVDARGDMSSGVFGEMMLTYFKGRGGIGVIIDGCIRDFPKARDLGLGYWLRGVTPNFHTQVRIFPHAVNIPIACGGRLVMPGDVIIADDDGAVVIPRALAAQVADAASEHAEWEEFSRLRLSQGGDLRTYYPLSDAARPEYEEWRKNQGQ